MSTKLNVDGLFRIVVLALCLTLAACGGSERKFTKHIEKGNEYYAAAKYKEAAIEFKNAAQIKPNDAQAHYHLGLSYLKVGGPAYIPSAYKALMKAAELDPNLLDAQVKLGELYFFSRDLVKAAEQADLVLQKDKDNLDANILLANIKVAKGKPADARKVLSETIKAHPESHRPYLALSMVHLSVGEKEAAKDALKMAIEKDGTVDSRLALSRLYLMEKNQGAAEEELNAALKAAPESVPALTALASLYIATGKATRAEETVERLIKASGGKAEGYAMLASIHGATGGKEKARETLKRGIANSTEPAQLQKILVTDYLSDRQTKEASEVIAALLDKNPNDTEGLFLRGRILLLERKAKEALPDLKASVDANPRSPFAQYYYGLANAASGNASTARSAFTEAVNLAPGFNDAVFMLAASHIEAGELKSAYELAKKLEARVPSYPGLGFLLGDISLRQGKGQDAVRYLEGHTKNNPKDAKGLAKLASAYRLAGNQKAAIEAAERSFAIAADPEVLALAVSIDLSSRNFDRAKARITEQIAKTPGDASMHVLLGRVQVFSGDAAGARQSFEKAIEINKDLYSAYVELGNLFSRKGSFDEALKSYRESVRVNPNALPSYMLIGVLSERKGDFEGAMDSYKKALDVNPKFAPAANNLAWLYSEKGGNIDVALTLAETAKGLLPDEPSVSDTLGWIYYKKQAYLKAITLLKESAAKLPNEPVVRYHLGMAYFKKGDKALAKQELRRSLELKRDFAGADEARATLAALK